MPTTTQEKKSGRDRDALLQALARELMEPAQVPVTARPADGKDVPASHGQEGVWLAERINPGTIAFNFPVQALRLEGELDTRALELAFDEAVRRHEALRTTFVERDGHPVQVVSPESRLSLPVIDLSSMPREARGRELNRLAIEAMEGAFDLAQGPLLRISLVRWAPRLHVLLLSVHHIVFDVGSFGILLADVAAIYQARAAGREPMLAPMPAQYADFTLWQRRCMRSVALRKQLEYWKRRLAGASELRFPTDRRRPASPSGRAVRETAMLPRELADRLKDLGRREGVTPFVLTLAAFCVLASRYAGEEDVVVGSPVTLRRRPEVERVVGLFANLVAIRADLSGAPTFRELLGRVREAALGALENSDAPFDHVVRELGAARSTRHPLFQITFAYETASPPLAFGGLHVEFLRPDSRLGPGEDAATLGIEFDECLTRFDIETYVREVPDGLELEMQGSSDVFTRETLRSLLGSLRALLAGVVARPDAPIAELPLLDGHERDVIVRERNATARDYPRDSTVAQVFASQAARRPDAHAVEHGDAALTYGELDARATRLAATLRSLGVRRGDLVGLAVPRSTDLVIGMLGILKAGAGYVPLDPDYPPERLAFMVDDTAAGFIVADRSMESRLSATGARFVRVDDEPPAGAPKDAVAGGPLDLAYIIYTSGSTGMPKGVQVTHRSIARLVCNTDYAQLGDDTRLAQASVATFDAATYEVWGALLNGGCVVIAPREVTLSPRDFAHFLRERRITDLFLTTALFNQVARDEPDAFATLRSVLTGGEALSLEPIRRVLKAGPPRQLNNIYGPTEVTTFALTHRIESLDEAATNVPIGRPIANTTAYVLDERGEPVPDGMPGELYLGGDGVALGYLNRDELTREKFVPDRFGADASARLYRTGDWVRCGPGGALEFIGRRDGQVKVRGFRIELGEIDAVLKRQPDLVECFVTVREDEPGEHRVVAYVVPRPETQPLPRAEDLRAVLRQHLPDYMVPAAFVVLPSLPLKPNGKIDREALPPPSASPRAAAAAPQGELQERIAALWREMLKLDRIGVDDNFFDVGGDSLMLVRMHARLREGLGIQCRVVDLFTYTTIESLARFLEAGCETQAVAQEAAALAARRSRAGGAPEPIAIIGMAGRFPGAGSVEAFWQNLREGRESIRFFTPEEMREAGVPEAAIADPRYVPARGYLDDADKFDAGFFGYSAREAEVMDPQQRVLLQCGAEALERAGYDPERYDGAIGVFAGSTMSTYLASLTEQGAVPESVGGLSRVMAMAQDFLTTRLSYKLNLRGPSVNVQSACSTSLVAVHEACRSLLDYDCDMALAGGVSVTVPLKAGYPYVEEGIGSPDGHCRAFDASAAGTVAGNAVALVVLKRLSEAIADGDHIHAVIRGIAVNNDGCAKVGYTAPSVEGQSKAIALAQALANCPPETIGYIEAHGTGTHLGDPIEISALRRVFGPRPRNGEPCWIGAVKANVGHLDAAAGVTGLVKAALAVEHAQIPPSINFVEPNPQIEFASSPFEVNTQLRAWKTPEGHTRRAGVSSFGLGGTNAHAVLEQAPAAEACAPGREWQLLCLSAKTPAALERMAANLAAHLRAHPELPLADVAHTLQAGRREFAHRRVVVARSHEQAACALESAADASAIAACKAGSRKPVFMFSGQGSQHVGMARGLYATEPVFREVVDQCCAKLRPMLGLDLVDVMFGATGAPEEAARRLEDTRLAQPALFVVEYATARTWMSWGVRPAAMIGHSIGEYAAACLADVIGLDDALRLVAERGRLMSLQAAGAMLAVPLDEAEVATLLGAELSLAAVNAPGLCVVSGPQPAIERLEAQLEARGLVPRRLHTSHAFHSAMMDPALEPFRAACSAVTLHAPRLAYVSNVSGDWITPEHATDPGYYATHLRGTVRFSQGLERLLADGDHVFVECGPGQTLASLARRHPARRGQACIASMRHPADAQEDAAAWLAAAGQLWLAGARPDWRAAHGGERRRRVLLPTYPFECKRYWLEARSSAAAGDAAVRRIADSKQWLYVPSWRRSAPPVADPAAARSKWLVLCDPHGVGSELVAHWRAAGFAVAEAAVPETRADCDRLLVWLRADAFVPDRIVHLGAVGPDVEPGDEPNFTRTCQARGFYGIVFLLQSLIAANLDTDVALAVVTSQALEVDGRQAISPDRAMAVAPCTAIGMEHPGIRARVVDVQLDSKPAPLAAVLARELASQAHDAVVAYRGGHRWVREFERVAPAQATSPAVREGGTYLITGGLGPMGLEIAAHFARVARANLVLLGRTASPSERIREIEAQGSKVLVLSADVGDAAQLAEAVARAEAQLGPIRGVVHAAGAQKRGAPIEAVTPVHCEAQFWPKLAGLRALERVFHGRPLDFFIVQSSLASVTGVAGFVSYTAAHVFMDAFVQRHNRRHAQAWRTVNWDNWRLAGEIPASASGAEFYLTPAEAVETLDRVLARDELAQVLVSTGPLQGRIDRCLPREVPQGEEQAAEQPAPKAHSRPALSSTFEAPRSEAERTLAGIWQDVLGIAGIGIHDNFFELGGDSVLNIQIIAKANRVGLRLTPRQVFENQTIAQLAALAGATVASGVATPAGPEQAGPVPLTPIQAWFFERGLRRPAHFNLPMLLEVRRALEPDIIARAIDRLARHHDALRLRYARGERGWTQELAPEPAPVNVERIELSGLGAEQQRLRIEEVGARLQKGLDLTTGRTAALALFDAGAAQPARLLFVVHHLVVDMISWRILLEDLQAACEALAIGREPVFPPKTASIRRWSEALCAYAQTPAAETQLPFWQGLARTPVASLPRDVAQGVNSEASARQLRESLDVDETRALLADLPRTFGSRIDDALLLALARSVGEWSDARSVLVDFEGHGREAIVEGVDPSRTVGWFTTLSPVRIDLPARDDAAAQLDAVHRQLSAIPQHGMGFGILRYLSGKPEVREALAALPTREISFLYAGQLDAAFAPDAPFAPIDGHAGEPHDPEGERSHLLEVNAWVMQGRLQVSWTYSANRHREETIRALARRYMHVLRDLLGRARADMNEIARQVAHALEAAE